MRKIFSLIFLCAAIAGCKNEPYQDLPVAVTNLTNHGANINNTYVYRDQKLFTFLSITGTDTLAYMRFHYAGDDLNNIVTDSTRASLKLTSFYRNEAGFTDSTFLNDTAGRHLVSARTVTLGGDGNPTSVRIKTWPENVLKDQLAELMWEDGNVVRLATFDLSSGTKTPVRDLSIAHDDQNCVFTGNNNYLFTLSLDELYWLSKNNPKTFNAGDGTKDKEYTYWYNKLGYPSNFKNETGVLYGAAYRQLF